jgi:DNA replication initiation complex subunit (GINS family)
MYDALYEAWLKEKESLELQKLPENFYTEAAEYIRRIQRESRMLESKSVKAKLISEELSKAKRMVKELIALRFEKLVSHVKSEGSLSKEALTSEEKSVILELRPSFEKFQSMLKDSIRGKAPEEREKTERTRSLLRFLSEVPAIVGADLKVYGPFAVEDVATLPTENAKVLVKRGVAMEIETR